MSDLRAAAEQALDTLEHVQAHIGRYDPPVVTTIARAMQPTIDALRAALAAEQPQPVSAWHAVADWLRDNYQDHPTIADLCDAMRAAAPPPAAPEPSANERRLRRLLCLVKHGRSAYMDDGEASDCSAHPSIDYLRDSLDEIEAKWRMRASATPAAPTEPSEAELPPLPIGEAEVVWHEPDPVMPERPGKIIDASIAFFDAAPLGTHLYTAEQMRDYALRAAAAARNSK